MEVRKLGEVFSTSALGAAQALSVVPASREHFLRVIGTWPENIKIEFINNHTILQCPPTHLETRVMDRLQYLLHLQIKKEEGFLGSYKTLVDFEDNLVMPDLSLFSKQTHEAIDSDQWLFPQPEVVIEVTSQNTSAFDHKLKLKIYEESRVLEFWLIEPEKSVITIYNREEAGDSKFSKIKRMTKASDSHEAVAFDELKVTHEQVFDPDYNLLGFSRAVLNSMC